MEYQLKFTDDAKQDIKQASIWYNKKRKNLGKEFLNNVELILLNLQQNPNQFVIIYKNVRKVSVNRFPYTILYVIRSKKIIIFAVFHTSRNPNIWKTRIID